MAKSSRGNRSKSTQRRHQQLLFGAVALAAVLVMGIFIAANRPTADAAYYKHVTPRQLDQIVQGGEPVLVYFHSPT